MNPAIATFSLPWWQIFLAGLSTLAVFSFLYKENPVYRIFEHIYIGVATAIGITATFKYFLWPEVLKPLFGYDLIPYPDGTMPTPYNPQLLLFIIPISFGGLYYFILSRKHAWIAQLVIGFSLGIGGGLAFKAILNEMLPQLTNSFRPLYAAGALTDLLSPSRWLSSAPLALSLSNIVFTITLVSSMSYFFFTVKHRPGGVISRSAITGRWLMMGCFGAFFGATIMARMALLVERLQFLIQQWWPLIPSLLHSLFQTSNWS